MWAEFFLKDRTHENKNKKNLSACAWRIFLAAPENGKPCHAAFSDCEGLSLDAREWLGVVASIVTLPEAHQSPPRHPGTTKEIVIKKEKRNFTPSVSLMPVKIKRRIFSTCAASNCERREKGFCPELERILPCVKGEGLRLSHWCTNWEWISKGSSDYCIHSSKSVTGSRNAFIRSVVTFPVLELERFKKKNRAPFSALESELWSKN